MIRNLRKNKKLLKINCSNNKIAELNLSNCEKLQSLVCHKNDLVSIDFPNNSINLTYVSCSENNLSDLSIFSGLSGVVKLFIGNPAGRSVEKRFNNFSFQSLKYLQNCKKLEFIGIDHTDVSGIEFLPENLKEITCAGCEEITQKLNGFKISKPEIREEDLLNLFSSFPPEEIEEFKKKLRKSEKYDFKKWRETNILEINKIIEQENEEQNIVQLNNFLDLSSLNLV